MRPGRNLLLAGGGLVALGLAAFFWGPAAWLVPFAIAAAAVAAVLDYRELRGDLEAISVTCELPAAVGRGRTFGALLRVANTGVRRRSGSVRECLPPSAEPEVWLEQFDLPPGGEAAFGLDVRLPVRGLHAFGPAWVLIEGTAGALEGKKRVDSAGEVKVLPRSVVSEEGLEKGPLSEVRILDEWTRSRLRGEGLEFESISEFREGDDVRRIDWRSSARHGRVMVRRYQLEQHRDLVILLDCGRLMGASAEEGSKLDRAVDSALMLARVALEKGDRCGLGVFDDQVLGFMPPVSGPAAFRTIVEGVYDVQSRWRETNFSAMFAALESRHPKRSLVAVLSDVVDADTSVRFRTALAALGRRHVVLFAAVRTPLLGRLVRTEVSSMLDVSRKAVALRVLRERERALHGLRRSGVHVLDVEPAQLTVPLVNRYIELRERNVL